MFFCSACEKRNNWPNSIFKSFGKCEVCGKSAPCSDVPSKYLPDPIEPAYVGKHRLDSTDNS